MRHMKKVVVIGGGTGTSVVLQALKSVPTIQLTAIVVVSDNGGSTGRLRDEFGFLPVGDLRQCIAALATGENEEYIRELLLYRFQSNSSLQGHNLGNLILTALEDLIDSPAKAIEIASKIFRIDGQVYPISEANVDLEITYEDGQRVVGEKNLDDPKLGGKRIKNIRYTKKAPLYVKARQAIENADFVLLGPGDLYGSLLANTLAEGFQTAMQQNKKKAGKFLYIANLMTHYSQTHQLGLTQHLHEVEKYCGRQVDAIIVNTAEIDQETAQRYAAMHEYPVADDLGNSLPTNKVIRAKLLAKNLEEAVPGDGVPRSLLRHDKQKLKRALVKVFQI